MAKLYVYDSYENRMLVYNNLNENDPMPYSYGSTLSVREFRGVIQRAGAVDHNARNGSVEPDPPPVWGGHPGGVCLQAHLGGRPRHGQPALCGRCL